MDVLVAGLATDAAALPGVEHVERVGDRLRLQVREPDLGRAITAVETAGGRVLGVQPVRQTLEDYFMREMGGAAGVAAAGVGAWGEG
jgi:carbon monoxide dehydrogenase subunit G